MNGERAVNSLPPGHKNSTMDSRFSIIGSYVFYSSAVLKQSVMDLPTLKVLYVRIDHQP